VCLVEDPSRAALLRALELAHEKGKQIFFDPNLRLEGNTFPEEMHKAQWDAITLSDIVLVEQEELKTICKISSIKMGAEKLLSLGVDLVVVKCGKNGVEAFSHSFYEHIPAFEVKVISTAGAGDSFDAGFISASLRNASTHDALIYANAVAAVKISSESTSPMLSHRDVLSFLHSRNQEIDF